MENINIKNFSGWVFCRSTRGSYDVLCSTPRSFEFKPGATLLHGAIDTGAWAISYALSVKLKKIGRSQAVLDEQMLKISIDDQLSSLKEVQKHACYLDTTFKLFRSRVSVKTLIERGLKFSKAAITAEELRSLFEITQCRFKRRLSRVGNEHFRCMAAIGYAWGLDVFCFPWMSAKMVSYYQNNIFAVLKVLSSLGKIAILPTEYCFEPEPVDSMFCASYYF